MTEQYNFKIIDKESKLASIKTNDLVQIVGISNPSQNERGLVAYSDGAEIGTTLVLVRNIQNRAIELRGYVHGPHGILQGKKTETYAPDSAAFKKYNKKMTEKGI